MDSTLHWFFFPGRSVPEVAIRWLLQKDVVTSVIIGARTLAQLDTNMAAANGWSLTKEEVIALPNRFYHLYHCHNIGWRSH